MTTNFGNTIASLPVANPPTLVINSNVTLTGIAYGKSYRVTGAYTITLPPIVSGNSGLDISFMNDSTYPVIFNCQGSDYIRIMGVSVVSMTLVSGDSVIFQNTGGTFCLADSNPNKASLSSPIFTGLPLAPTAAINTNTTQLATTAFVIRQASGLTPSAPAAVASAGASNTFSRGDHVHPPTDALVVNYTPKGTGAVITTAQDVMQRVVYADDYMTQADRTANYLAPGSVDVAYAIQKAIDLYGFVNLLPTVYGIKVPIVMKNQSATGLIGTSCRKTELKALVSMTCVVDLYDATTDTYAGISDYKLHNINLNGNLLATYGLYVRFRHRLDARSVRVEGCTYGFWMADSWMNTFHECYSHYNANGFWLEGANHNSAYNQCSIEGSTAVPLQVGGINRTDGNMDIVFRNLLIDSSNTTQITVDMGGSVNSVLFDGGYIGEFSVGGLATTAIVKVNSGKAVFRNTKIFANDSSGGTGGMSLFWRNGGDARFENCTLSIYDYAHIYHTSSTNVGSLTIANSTVSNGNSYAAALIPLSNAFTISDSNYKTTSKRFGAELTCTTLSGPFIKTYTDAESIKWDCTANGAASVGCATRLIPINTGYFILIIEYVSNIGLTLRFNASPLSGPVWDAAVIPASTFRSTLVQLLINPYSFTITPANVEIIKQAGTTCVLGDYLQIFRFTIIPISDTSSEFSLNY